MTIINKKADGKKWKRSSLEAKFDKLWNQMYPKTDLIVEQCLIEGRRFRTDYLHLDSKVTIEVNGGTFLRRSGHKGVSSLSDYEKANQLLLQGYVTINLGTTMITKENLKLVYKIIKNRTK